jgi:transposase
MKRNAVLRERLRHAEARLRRVETEMVQLRQLVRELSGSARATAVNSSIPPSANPPGAPTPRTKKPTGGTPGGQLGHEGHFRQLLPAQEVDEVVEHGPPVRCRFCGAMLPVESDREVVGRHQVMELPARAVRVAEHRALACRCGRCGRENAGTIPEAVRSRSTGPRLSAAVAMMACHFRGSRRCVERLVGEVLGAPLSLGSVVAREREMGQALGGPYEEVLGAVRRARVKHVDETSWRRAAHWLFAAASAVASAFALAHARTYGALKQLLGETVRGTLCTDRFGIYDRHPLERRAVCWAHLKRDFRRCVDRGGASARVGEAGLAVCRRVFALWRELRGGSLSRSGLRERVEPLRRRMHALLLRGTRCGVKKTAGFCRNVLRVEVALWRFAEVPGLEPTNNAAERALRPAVLWRKQSLGSHSRAGCRFVEQILSVTATLRRRGRKVLDYLEAALAAHRLGQPPPSVFAP